MHGRVKFYNSVDGYGFIQHRGRDVYVHRSAIADGQMLLRGDKVSFDVAWKTSKVALCQCD